MLDPYQLLRLARQAGAEQAEVYISQSREQQVSFEANRLKQIESAQESGCALTVWQKGRAGMSVAFGPLDPDRLVEKALNALRVAPHDHLLMSQPWHFEQRSPGLNLPVKQLCHWGKQMIAQLRAEIPQVLCYAGTSQEENERWLVNSEGLDCRHQTRSYSAALSVEWVRGEDFLQVSDSQTITEGIPDLSVLVEHCRQRLLWAKHTAAPSSGHYPVLFTSDAVPLLLGPVLSALDGRLVHQQASPWWNALGQKVLHPALQLSQDPTLGPGALPFDDEGTPTQALTLIEDGVLKTFYSDLGTAHRLGSPATGNGFRDSLGSFAAPALVNLLVRPGALNFEQLLSQIDRGLILEQTLGNEPGLAGNFSLNVDLGYWVEDGEIVGRVKDTMLSGNVYSLLQEELQLGQATRWRGDMHTPALLLPRVALSH